MTFFLESGLAIALIIGVVSYIIGWYTSQYTLGKRHYKGGFLEGAGFVLETATKNRNREDFVEALKAHPLIKGM